jgi:hypothetical protein
MRKLLIISLSLMLLGAILLIIGNLLPAHADTKEKCIMDCIASGQDTFHCKYVCGMFSEDDQDRD